MNQEEKSSSDSFLKFNLEQQTPCILAMAQVQEVLIVASRRITPMPNMPECVLGLVNRRNRVLWVIDLALMLSLQPLGTNAQQYNLIIIQAKQITLGLLVQEVKGVTHFASELIQAPTELVTSALIPYLSGCIVEEQEVLLVLSAEAIVLAPTLYRN
ncbi:MAG TPA: chemotaxis protein CheW [Cyanobacteria bacterium UBA11049]|nr:chemotaxis protein CheW [Cyanobacteria bacterium UBA11049]